MDRRFGEAQALGAPAPGLVGRAPGPRARGLDQGQARRGHPCRRTPNRRRPTTRPRGRCPPHRRHRRRRRRVRGQARSVGPGVKRRRRRFSVKVAIIGAGNVGTSIATDLAAGDHDVLLIDKDVDLVERLRSELDLNLVAADGCEVTSLDAAGLASVDVVIAATGDDEDNLVISLLSKQEFAVPRVIARVNNPKNQWIFNESWGVDVSVCMPLMMTALVEEAVSVGSLVRLLRLERGHASLVEVTLADHSPAVGVSLADLEIPRDATVVAVVRRDRLVVPRGDTVLEPGDEVLALVMGQSEQAVQAMLVGN